ncbi:hypothetical protein [Tritonibacter mobilis]|uniref:hypothetical protein n=1 Tax=Tritonibacter mobilis TaxID=379347 RepID=UPI000E0CF731|nr:hypothetical protein [Tritonibacter mobilis]
MFERLEDYYTQSIRIDLTSADQLARLNPENVEYRIAAQNNRYVVSVLQGDVQESVYSTRMQKVFDTFDEAQQTFLTLLRENPDAEYFDFVRDR